MGAIGKREYENDVVWIILQFLQLKWERLTIPKVKEYGAYLMSILYADPNHRNFFNPDTVQDEEKNTTYVPIVVMLTAILGPIFCDNEKVMGVAQNCERRVRSK